MSAHSTVDVLVVEDDEDDFLLTRDLLHDAGVARYRVDRAKDFDDAMSAIDRGHLDVMLVDYRLGGRDGLDVVREARRRRCDAPVILLTGQTDASIDLAAMEAGAADFLPKGSLTAPTLERTIRYAIAHRRSERQRLEMLKEQLRAQAAQRVAEADLRAAREASDAKDRFLAVISHELRTPLNAILGWAEVLNTELRPPPDRPLDPQSLFGSVDTLNEGVDAIERNARAQQQLVEDLLDVTRIVAGKVRLRSESLSLADVLRAAAESVAPAARRQGVTVRLDIPGVSPTLVGDPTRLQQVFWNLLSNAIKFSKAEDDVLVRVTASDGVARVDVVDQGVGLRADDIPHIFDRFYQAGQPHDTAATGRPAGLGLGLAIVRHLVESHGGTIEAVSDGVGLGSTFTVTLPLKTLVGTPDR